MNAKAAHRRAQAAAAAAAELWPPICCLLLVGSAKVEKDDNAKVVEDQVDGRKQSKWALHS